MKVAINTTAMIMEVKLHQVTGAFDFLAQEGNDWDDYAERSHPHYVFLWGLRGEARIGSLPGFFNDVTQIS
jgi:hypothetical protein